MKVKPEWMEGILDYEIKFAKPLLERAKKYADIYDDLAVKSEIDSEYWQYRNTAELFRELSSLIVQYPKQSS
jgi:hypothetical protein